MTAPPAGPAVRRRGNRLGFWFFRIATRLTGLRGAYGLLFLVCPYYLLFDRPATRSALAYLRRRFPDHSSARLHLDALRLFISQGRALIDRHAALARPDLFRIDFPSLDLLRAACAAGRGVVLLLAHTGNWQLGLGCLPRLGRPVTLVMRPEDNPAVAASLQVNPDADGLRVLAATGDADGAVRILQRLEAGEVVCLMADRSYQFRSAALPFLGESAQFPIGPYQFARSAGSPVLLLTSHRAAHRHYVLEVEPIPPPDQPALARSAQLAAWAGQFARCLERYARLHPFQVFLFHDIWAAEPASAVDKARTDSLSMRGPVMSGTAVRENT